jgi:UDP-N-acetylmuramoyl-L-alanyl-D-glutamate--2,6-diaminopimelate ligase
VSYRVGAEERPAARTTPEAPEVQRMLREILDSGMRACAMEVSSHALMLHRVDATRFTAAVFTNLTRDHLDFHADMESYFLAKKRLFEMLPPDGVAITNLDDPRGAAIVEGCGRIVSYGLTRPADVMPAAWRSTLEGLTIDVRTPRGPLHVRSRLVGAPNACNILATVATATALDVPFAAIEQGLAGLESVPGRFQVVSGRGDDVTVVVDYAHTDDALRNLLETARPLAKGRIVTVFGCGGDRDRSKRPLMGAVAARLSDLVIVTSDNPRSEDPREIIDDILRGIKPPKDRLPSKLPPPVQRVTPHLVVVDRHVAIERAIREAIAGDLVLVAGKGHEKYQEAGGRVVPFDDVEIAREALTRRRLESHVS